jgi:hypothetical protein
MNTLSDIQSKRRSKGVEYESYIIDKYDLTPAVYEDHLVDNVGKIYHIDAFFSNMMIEITMSARDGKEAKLRLEAKLFKRKFPNKYFIILIKEIGTPRSDGYDSVYDHLVSDRNIDKVLVGEEEFKKHLNKPSYKKLTNNKIGDNNVMIERIIDRCIEKDASGFLADFTKSYGDSTSSKGLTGGKTPHMRIKLDADNTVESIKSKNPKLLREDNSEGKVSLAKMVKMWGYADSTLTKPQTVFSGRIGKLLVNGAVLYTNTDNPSYHTMSKLLTQLYIDADTPSPKINR